ncbi:MAG TPA: response regulator [Acidiferrobacteraceae bacterium]|nr:response regulator [Acidiferrobacteraceae bacterium]
MNEVPNSRSRVLLADDSRVIRKAVAQVLRQEFEILECDDGESAWGVLATEAVDLVITDVEMPRLDGFGLLARIRAASAPLLRDLPVIVVTGANDEATRARALDAGATDFVVKPIDRTQLLARVRGQVKLERANRDLTLRAEEQTLEDLETGIGNRHALWAAGSTALAYARRHNQTLALVQFHFARTEHSRPLPDLAQWLRTRVRQEETLGHLGAATFALVAPCQDAAEATAMAQRLQRELQNGEAHFGQLDRFGVALLTERTADIGNLLEEAERAAQHSAPLASPTADCAMPAPHEAAHTDLDPSTAATAGPDLLQALAALKAGNSAEVLPHLRPLILEVLPLLELCNQKYAFGLTFALRSFRDKLTRI